MWIDVKDSLPEITLYLGTNIKMSDDLLIVSNGIVYGEIRYKPDIGFVSMEERGEIELPYEDVTHWMYYPKPPII